MQALTDDMCQKIAKEMNLSDTAFVIQKSEDDTHAKGLVQWGRIAPSPPLPLTLLPVKAQYAYSGGEEE